MVKTLSTLYLEARRAFMAQEDQQTASLLARNLLCHITGKSQEVVIADREMYATGAQCEAMEAAVQRILNDEPLAYVLGEWEFYGMTLTVTPDVLIPRDDTCAVTALAIHQALFLENAPRILDLCTGSGCIGLAIAARVKDARVTLADVSRQALAVAKKNIVDHHMSARVSCVTVDALSKPAPFLGKFDMIVSNPPYITTQEMLELPGSVKNFEPELALHGGEDGLDFYRAIVEKWTDALHVGGRLYFEVGIGQADSVLRIMRAKGYGDIQVVKDLAGIPRVVFGTLLTEV
jgi:release factor glutamine methyltransferase